MKRSIQMLIFALAAFLLYFSAGQQQTEEESVPVQQTEIPDVNETDIFHYMFHVLSSEEQTVYQEVYMALDSLMPETPVSASNAEYVYRILEAVLADHPEIFYTDGFDFILEPSGMAVFRPVYTMSQAEILNRQELIALRAEQILALIPAYADDYQKIRFLYEYLLQNTEYTKEARENQSLVSALIYGESVCRGYAKAFQHLCQKAGIPAVQIGGTANGEGHAWTLVQSNGEWYHTDPAWGEVCYRISGNEERYRINYDYLMITTDQILNTHRIDGKFPLPECSSRKDNYYEREGLLLESVDESRIERLFQMAYDGDQESLTMKCADEEVYHSILEELIENQKIFEYMPDTRKLIYSCSEEQQTLTFWLK